MENTFKAPAKRRVFFDMDGVLADFDKLRQMMNMTGDEMKRTPGAFAQLEPIEGAIAGVRSVIGMGFDVWIATKPPTGVAQAYADKAGWILQHLPELKRKIIVTHHKGMLGGADDFLVDDRPHKASCEEFAGELVHFGPVGTVKDWAALVELFRQRSAPPAPVVHAKPIICPSREAQARAFREGETTDFIRADDTCSYCGSLDPDVLMARIEAGTIIVEGSDKNYKAYLKVPEGAEMLKMSTRIDDDRTGDQSKWVWQTREVDHGKFYFDHLSIEQRLRFIELWNQKKIKHSLYRMPFFMTPL